MEKADIQKEAKSVAKTLHEKNRYAIEHIERLIKHLGLDFVQKHVEETQRIESEGGLMIKNGNRRRTPGGVFFYIVKEKLRPEQRTLIFPPVDWKKRKAAKKRKAQVKEAPEQTREASPDVAEDTSTSNDPSSGTSVKLAQLERAADILRERVAEMEAKGQKGLAMTKILLKNTEKQLQALQKENVD